MLLAGRACWDGTPILTRPPYFLPSGPPEQVLLKLQPMWVTVGKSFIIECRVPTVAPLETLTLTLLRGKEPLHMQAFGRATAVPGEAMITYNRTAHKEDGRHNFSCQAELDLRSRGGGIIRRTSEPQVLDVYGEEEPPIPGWRTAGQGTHFRPLGKSKP